MVGALFDTNILIDHLNGIPQARLELGRYDAPAISIVSWMEVMVGVTPDLADPTRRFLEGFKLIALDSTIAERAVALRCAYRIKLPDAIVWASAQTNGFLLVTRNIKDFPPTDPGIREPYIL